MQVVAINVKGVLRGDLDKVVVAKEISKKNKGWKGRPEKLIPI
jgi:hypothetical protein